MTSPLIIAIKQNNLNQVKKLSKKYNVDVRANNNQAIYIASECGYLNIVKYLVSKGANVRAGRCEAIIVASSKGHLHVVKYLVSLGVDVRDS